MFFKILRSSLTLLVAVSLISCGNTLTNTGTRVSANETTLQINAPAFVTGSLFTQPVDPSGKLYLSSWLDPDGSDFDQKVWDNFTLQSDQTITEIDWFGAYDPMRAGLGGPVLDFTVAIYPSIAAGTEPAVAGPPLVEYQTGGSAGETSIGLVNGIPMYSYAFSLPTPFNASAGVKYWVHIVASQQGSSPDWSIAAGLGGDGSHYRWGSGAGGDSGFRSVPGDAAFTLLGPVPDIPTVFLSNTVVDENQPINTVVGELSAANSDPNATFTFSLACAVASTDDASFNILGTNLRTSATFDFETKSAYNICIRVMDQGGLTLDQNFVITVNNVNEAPTDISLSNSTVNENQPLNTVVGSLSAIDPDASATFTFSLACAVAGIDDGSFNILGTNLQTSAIFDFETKSAYTICIHVTDQGGLTLDKNFVVTLNDLNEAPTDISLSNMTVDENQPTNMVVGALTATDPDAGATFTFSLACAGADNGSFHILGTNLQTSGTFDFEAKSVYNICIRVTDQGGLTFDKSFIVTVNNVIEAPMDILLSANSVNENQPVNTVVGTLTATDPDPNATFTFSLTCAVPGTDDSAFNILGADLRTSATFDFESKSSYSICIRVTNQGGLTFDRNFAIIVNNLNEAPTGLSLSANSVDENRPVNTMVGALTATDPDAGATYIFSLTCAAAGADDLAFNINGSNLQTSAAFDFETKSVYNICIRVTDQGGLTFDKNFVITVNNVNEAPMGISLSNTTVDENQPINTVVGALTATDPDAGATFTFSLTCATAGADDGSFNLLGTNLRTSAIFDFETKSVYNICIRVTDQGGLSFDKNFVVAVNNINEPPIGISLSNTTVNENQPVNTVVGALTATDPDAGATFTFSLTCAAVGADDGSFNLLGTNLRTSAIFDFETKTAYNICLRVTDQGGLTFDKNFVITVNNLFENAAPTDILLSNNTVSENQPINTMVGELTATDPDPNATFTFSLTCAVAGADDLAFNINGSNLQTSAIFDFETKSVYNICLRVTDQGGLTFDKNFVITVNNLFENAAPTDILLSNNTVSENQPINTMVGELTATDPDPNATFTFSLTCAAAGADDGSFNLLGTNLRTSAIFDFETKSVYNICLRVTDQGGLSFDKNFVVAVNNINEASTDISLSNMTVDENQPINTVVGALTATDPDAGATFTFSLTCAVAGADDLAFNINGSSLQASAIFDFETKSVYNICLRVMDQDGLTFDKNFVITVNNLFENAAPTDISLSNTVVNENQPVNTVVGTLSATDPDAGAIFTFSLACAGADNGSFNILGTSLRTSATFDFETRSVYTICIRVTDQGGLTFDKNFVITVNNVNEATNTPGKVTGGGGIGSDKGGMTATFGFTINYSAGNSAPNGNLTYQDHKNNLRLKAISFDLLVIEGNHAWFTGMGTLNDGQVVRFRVEMDALSKLGQPDTFYIYIPSLNGYEAGGPLNGGNITIH